MKKMMFALACAAACAAAWADPAELDAIGFESYTADTVLVNGMDDAGSTDSANAKRFAYASEAGSADASTVKAFDTTPSAPVNGAPKDGFLTQYLELATEGGTLWRAINAPSTVGDISTAAAYTIPADGLFIDTMVQFTPTEDGADQTVGADDKLAIWLNVDTANNTTNLMVKGSAYSMLQDESGIASEAATYVLQNADGTALTVEPGTWYRLTVKAVKNLASAAAAEELWYLPGFQIYLDKVPLATVAAAAGNDVIAFLTSTGDGNTTWDPYVDSANAALLTAKTFIPSLQGKVELQEGDDYDDFATLTAVGFKGSGMIDDYVVTEIDPINQGGGSYDFTLSWDSTEISAVKYVIEGVTNDAVNEATVTLQAAATVSLIATPQDWYVLDDASVADLTVDGEHITRTISATEATSESIVSDSTTAAELGITGGAFENANAATLGKVVTWAKTAGKTPEQVSEMSFSSPASYTTAEQAYLLGVAEAGLDAAKAAAETALSVTITSDGSGGFIVTSAAGSTYQNGTVQIHSATSVAGEYSATAKTGDSLFYKAVLVFE